jgi:hypothetical protein
MKRARRLTLGREGNEGSRFEGTRSNGEECGTARDGRLLINRTMSPGRNCSQAVQLSVDDARNSNRDGALDTTLLPMLGKRGPPSSWGACCLPPVSI